jgi:hypothetical protein
MIDRFLNSNLGTIVAAIVVITWIAFPFLVLARMGRIERLLISIRDHSKPDEAAGRSTPPPIPPAKGKK